jgi:beta-lactamase superfamily II metal-dependent hydrolase
MRLLGSVLGILGVVGAGSASAQSEGAQIRVVDVGPGLCVVASFPGGHDLLYDAGHWRSSSCRGAVAELVADGIIDLVIISHGDSDHLGELPEILSTVRARQIIHTGDRRTAATWRQAMDSIEEAELRGTSVINLRRDGVVAGTLVPLGPATVTVLAGWGEWDSRLSTGPLTSGERHNVISIVARVEYRGTSVLLTGDTIGRALGSEAGRCDHAERWIQQHNPSGLRSNVLVAPHHGGDNGSATCFIQAVAPEAVIFSAGHEYRHPTAAAALRYLMLRPRPRIYRTDYGDDEGPGEWTHGRRRGCRDLPGDDDVEIRIAAQGSARPNIRYRVASELCPIKIRR